MVRLNQVRSSKRLGLGASSGHGNGAGCKRQRAPNTISAIAFITHIRRCPSPPFLQMCCVLNSILTPVVSSMLVFVWLLLSSAMPALAEA